MLVNQILVDLTRFATMEFVLVCQITKEMLTQVAD